MYETDLYPPLKAYFEGQGYTVNAEVMGVDAAAVKGGELVLLELKSSFNMKLLYQAIDRQKISDMVYMVIPRPKKMGDPSFKKIMYIADKLELGLITVALDSPYPSVDVVVEPAGHRRTNVRRQRAMIREIDGRTMDGNQGGSVGKKILTAFRERSIRIACILHRHGPLASRELVRNFGCGEDTYRILYANHYHWFEKCPEGHGVYRLSPKGIEDLEKGDHFREAIGFYQNYLSQQVLVRELAARERSFLKEMLYEAVFIPEGEERPPKAILREPKIAAYVKDFGRDGDLALAALVDGQLIGAAWVRLFDPERDKAWGYGFVDAQTPELSIALTAAHRGRKAGSKLMEELLKRIKERGYKRVSLSVDMRNKAFVWYKKLGFEAVEMDGDSCTMVKAL